VTEGEKQFGRFCSLNGIKSRQIAETPTVKTADYEILLNGSVVLIEIKDFDMNPEETDALRELDEQGVAVWGSSGPGARIRRKIDRAHSQLTNACELEVPALIVLYDNRDPAVAIVSDYEILVAMYGYQTIAIGGRHDGQHFFGGGQQMTPETRAYISGIGVLTAEPALDIYLNWFAQYPLSPFSFPADARVCVYALPHSPLDGFARWIPVTSSPE
jgi:hypothetical protein